jgi:3-phenylpropionate/trans-cinnamate dioxygenase ferredoxin reductase component
MRIVIVGAGLAAQRCAEALRANGHDGPITMYGAEPHAPYDRPPLSKAVLAGERPELSLRPPTWHADHDVDLRTDTRVTSLDELAFDRLLIATGANPVMIPALAGRENVHVLRTLDDALRLEVALAGSEHIAIVGGGLIGQEVASSAVARGVKATLIDAVPNPFDALMGPGSGHHLKALHEQAGVELKLGRRLLGVRDDGALHLDDGSWVEPDHVLVAVGVRPATEWTPWPAGIPVDGEGRTPIPNVFAAGDATGVAHWEAASRQGTAAARAMLGLAPRAEQPPLVWSDQHGVRIQVIGNPRGATNLKGPGPFMYERDGRIVAVVLMNDPGGLREARRLIDTPIREAA